MNAGAWRAAPVLGVADVEKSLDYFCESLGFQCDRATSLYEGPEGAVYAVLQRGSICVHLQVRQPPIFPVGRGRLDTDVYFYVPDADTLYAELKAKSVRVLREIENADYGLRDFVIETPDGHRLMFGSEL